MNKEQAKFMFYSQVCGLAQGCILAKKRMRVINEIRIKNNFIDPKGYAETQYNWLMIRYQTRHHQLAYGLIRGIPWYEATHATRAFHDDELIYLEGLRGQCLFIHPRHDLVVLRMGERPKKDWDMSWMINQLCTALN